MCTSFISVNNDLVDTVSIKFFCTFVVEIYVFNPLNSRIINWLLCNINHKLSTDRQQVNENDTITKP